MNDENSRVKKDILAPVSKCMFSIVTPGYQKKYRAMLKSFLLYNKGWDIILFYTGNINIPEVTCVEDITNDLSLYPLAYSLKEKVWAYRAQATYRCLQYYQTVVYCDSDLKFYSQLPSYQKTTFTLHLNHGYTEKVFNVYCKYGFINTGFYCAKSDQPTKEWFLFASNIFRDATLINAHHKDTQLWDQKIYCFLPWKAPRIFNLQPRDTINVAYWNIQQRPMTKINDKYYIGQQPLIVFHFSFPNKLAAWYSKYPALRSMVQEYIREIR